MLLQLLHKMTSWTDSIMNIVHALGKNLSCHKVPIDQAWHDIDSLTGCPSWSLFRDSISPYNKNKQDFVLKFFN